MTVSVAVPTPSNVPRQTAQILLENMRPDSQVSHDPAVAYDEHIDDVVSTKVS